jgi:hypothetical protein
VGEERGEGVPSHSRDWRVYFVNGVTSYNVNRIPPTKTAVASNHGPHPAVLAAHPPDALTTQLYL